MTNNCSLITRNLTSLRPLYTRTLPVLHVVDRACLRSLPVGHVPTRAFPAKSAVPFTFKFSIDALSVPCDR